jgi:hypothetical protein
MLINKLRIDSQIFYLEPDEDVVALKKKILDTARGTTDYVIFKPIGHGTVTVMVNPYTPVRFEEQEHTEDELQAWENRPPPIDFNFDFDTYGGNVV